MFFSAGVMAILVAQVTAATGPQPESLVVGDFNGDGFADIATGNTGNVTVLLGKGDGTFQAAKNVAALGGNQAMAVAAFRDAGPEDIITVSNAASAANNAMLLLGSRDAGVVAQTPFSLPAGSASAVVAADFNGDGKQDFAVVVLEFGVNTVAVFPGNGNGTFATPTLIAVGGTTPAALAVGSFHGAGKVDLAVTDASTNSVVVLLNNAGNFTLGAGATVGNGAAGIAAGDFNHDGNTDLAVANSTDGTVSVLIGDGTGAFTAHAFPAGADPTGVAVADFDGDGKLDIAVVNQSGNSVSFLAGNGDGTFAAPSSVAVGTAPVALAPGNFTGHGNPAVAVANSGSNKVTVLSFVSAPATFTVGGPTAAQTVAAGQPASFAIATGAVSGAAPGTVTFTAAGLPTGAAAGFAPASVAAGASTTMTVTTTARTTAAAFRSPRGHRAFPAALAFVLVLGLSFAGGVKKALRLAALSVLAAACAWLAGCGSNTAPAISGTPAGTYTIAVTATAGAEAHSTQVTLIVQ
jgi:hypothetical protein